ncbi:MAG: PD-(D/E)XK nuclease family protein [Candidatus Rokubacteria bacterium]|nr:PD-(D/E)XK nuclease family protein [Candidatus Rokubacteria bacterium]
MYPFLTQLAELCRVERTRAKWVLVPTHALGHTLGERLALEGKGWANLRFTTPLDLALPMAAPFLVERGIDPAPDGIGPALVMRLVLELPSTVPSYFRHLAEQPKMAEALWGAIRELRMAGFSAGDLPPRAFESPAKRAELAALLEAYESHLTAQHLADTAAVYLEALLHADVCPVRPGDLWTELPGVIWAPLERRLLEVLPGNRVAPTTLAIPGLETPRRLRALQAGVNRAQQPVVPAPRSDAERLAFLMRPAEAPPPVGDGTLALFRAGGQEAEVEEVFRRILAAEIGFDQVEIACAGPDHVRLIWEKAQRHGWPVTVGPGIPVALTRPARALLAFCAWVEGGFPAAALRRLLQSGDVRLDVPDGPSSGQAARLLAQSGAAWARETYAPALAGLAESLRERAENMELDEDARNWSAGRASQAEHLAGWIAGVLDLVPAPEPDGRIRLGAVLSGCRSFLDRFAAVAGELDGAARSLLGDALGELGAIGDLHRPLAEVLRLVRDRVEGLSVGGDRARPGHLHVTTLAQAGYAGRPRTFVVGLEESGVFPQMVEDPVLLDEEREPFAVLANSRDRVEEALFTVVSRLAALGGRVCLSHSCRDLRESRETFPSWLMLQALRLLRPADQVSYGDLDAALGEPASVVPARAEQALSDAGWWLAGLRGVGPASQAAIVAAFPPLARGEAAEVARLGALYTAYDGHVPAAGPRLDPRGSDHPVSATRLERLAACPFRYFLERGLGLEAVEDAEPEPDRWLDPLTRGGALHELYAMIMREARGRGERPDPARHGERLRQLGQEKLRQLRALVPPPSERVFEHEARVFLRDLDVFLALEAGTAGRVPVGFEVPFGTGEIGEEPLGRVEPIQIDLGGGLRFLLRGGIDRVDRLADGSYEIVDYKTGSAYLPGGLTATFAGGRQLQHALYALAAAELLRATDPAARVAWGSYYFPTSRGRGERVRRPQGDPRIVAAVLSDLFDVLAGGAFVHTTDAHDCKYCEFPRACGRDPVARAAVKVEHESNAALAPYRRLGERE